jgi:hypothetical protein
MLSTQSSGNLSRISDINMDMRECFGNEVRLYKVSDFRVSNLQVGYIPATRHASQAATCLGRIPLSAHKSCCAFLFHLILEPAIFHSR